MDERLAITAPTCPVKPEIFELSLTELVKSEGATQESRATRRTLIDQIDRQVFSGEAALQDSLGRSPRNRNKISDQR